MYIGNTKPALKDLYDYVAVQYAVNWKQLGRNLNSNENFLKIIEKDHPQSCEDCCNRMLYEWIELTPNATWGTLVEAVDKLQSTLSTFEGMYVLCLASTSMYVHSYVLW